MSMKMITDVTIDLYGEIQYYMASAKQGDKATRYIRVQLMNNGNEFQIPDDVILIANIKKPDGKFCYNQCERENNRVMVQLTSQALAAAGTAYCDIEMRDSDDKLILSSAAFSIEIEKSMRNEEAIESCNEITFLEKKVQQYIDSMLEVRKQILSTEEAFKVAEAARVLAENGRVDAENIRRENETERVTAEKIRQEQLLEMQGATKTAIIAASRADTAADTAKKTEEAVNTAEAARVLAENGRVDAENIRRENETKRVEAEEIRQEHLNNKSNPHNVTKVQVGLGNVNNTADVNKPVSTAQQNAIDSAYQQATGYTNQKIADLIGGAPETLDTLKEVADAIQANKDVSTALDAAIGKKANQTELDTHTGNNTIHIASTERTNWNDANTKKHTHSNKGVLDKITQALLDSWNAAYTHISDAVKHITAEERSKWNAAKAHADSAHAPSDAEKNIITTIKENGAALIPDSSGAVNITAPTDYIVSGSQTATSTADGGTNTYTFTRSDGTKSTFNVKNGSKGSTGATGPAGAKGATGAAGPTGAAGTRGSMIYWGTAITGTSTAAAIFSGSGVSSALVNDFYLNTSTWNVYQCTTAGAASAAKWVYKGNIKGAAGSNATVTIDSALSETSKNPVQNKAITEKINTINKSLTEITHNTHDVTINGVKFGTLEEERNGKFVTITFSGSGSFANIAGATTYTIASLTNGPYKNFYTTGIINSGINNQSYCALQFTTGGTITFSIPAALTSTRTLKFSATYLVN